MENGHENGEKKRSRRKEKTYQANLRKGKKLKLNDSDILARLDKEDTFITSVLKFLPKAQQSESLLNEKIAPSNKNLNIDTKISQMKEKQPELFGSETRAQNYSELRRRIQERLKQFKSSNNKRTLSLEQKREQKKLKKQEQNIRRKEIKLQKKQKSKGMKNVSSISENKQNKPFVEKDGKMVFSKFDFNEKMEKKANKKPDYQDLLKQLESKKQKISELKETGEHQAVLDEAAWDKAMNLAEGKKVLDDPELIKKTIKKNKSQRERHLKAWDKRTAAVEHAKQKRQEKREANLKARKTEHKNRKLKKLRKHGRLIPGFS